MLVPETFSTERLFMRRPKASDAAAVFAYGSDKEVAEFADWPRLERLEDAAAAIENAVRRWDSGDEYSWRMTVKPDDTAVGGVACSIKGPRAEFGFIVARRLWGHGYATEAAHPVLEWTPFCRPIRRPSDHSPLGDFSRLIRPWGRFDS